MLNTNEMKTTNLFFHWAPRLICILAILFLSMFAFDVFNPNFTLFHQILGLLIHLVPSFFLLVILLVAWKWERIGGIILTITGVILSILVFFPNYRHNHSVIESLGIVAMISLPFIISGILFLADDYRKSRT